MHFIYVRVKCIPVYSITVQVSYVVCKLFLIFTCTLLKNTHLHFPSYLPDWCVDLHKNCSEYTRGMVDSDSAKVDIHCGRWRNYDITFDWL